MITLQFSTTNHFSSRAIRFLTWSDASHVDFVLPDGTLLGALGDGGVKYHDSKDYTIINRFTVDAPDSVIEFAKTQIGKPYDWPGIFGLVFRNRDWESDDKWFCSELVAWSFKQAGYPLLNETSYRITPRDLLISPLLKPIRKNHENNEQ